MVVTDRAYNCDMSLNERLPPLAPGIRQTGAGRFGFMGFGHLDAIRVDPLGTLATAFETHGDVTLFRFGPLKAFLLADPDHIEHVLIGGRRRYDKKVVSYQILRLLLGDGLLTADGELWQRQRRIATPAFQRGRILSFGDLIVAEAQRTGEQWQASSGSVCDMHREMMALTLRIAASSLLGVDVERHTPLVKQALEAGLDYFDYRIHKPLSAPTWVPTPRNLRFRRQRTRLVKLVRGMIAERRRGASSSDDGAGADDFLGRLMSARDEVTGEAMSDRQLQDEVMTILLAGHETTAATMTFIFHLLAAHPEVADKLHRELDTVLGGRTPKTDDLSSLPYTKAVVEESMRLMPPAWIIERRALEPDRIGDFDLPKGGVALMSQWLTHRHPRHWPEPEAFKPERFLGDASRGRHRFAYFPFGGGERVCIGGSFALLEARLILATLAQRFAPVAVPDFELELDAGITLRPRGGLPMHIETRTRRVQVAEKAALVG